MFALSPKCRKTWSELGKQIFVLFSLLSYLYCFEYACNFSSHLNLGLLLLVLLEATLFWLLPPFTPHIQVYW